MSKPDYRNLKTKTLINLLKAKDDEAERLYSRLEALSAQAQDAQRNIAYNTGWNDAFEEMEMLLSGAK